VAEVRAPGVPVVQSSVGADVRSFPLDVPQTPLTGASIEGGDVGASQPLRAQVDPGVHEAGRGGVFMGLVFLVRVIRIG
jgi:hypothetical protein